MSVGKVAQGINSLSAFEATILDNIKSLLNKNIVFQFNQEFIEYISQKVQASETEIHQALYSLLQRKYIVPGTALTRERVLENHNRALIQKTIFNQPGIHIRELCTKLNLSSGVVRAHLRILEMFGYIRKKTYQAPKISLLFSNDYPETYDDYFLILKNENDQRIIQLLLQSPLTTTELSSQLGVHHSTVQYHLNKLERLNLVIRIQEGHTTKVQFNEEKKASFLDFLDRIVPYLDLLE
ncbi:MAG: ArsR family transcriptional regulator [Candidatus Helarchaeota archaeon]